MEIEESPYIMRETTQLMSMLIDGIFEKLAAIQLSRNTHCKELTLRRTGRLFVIVG